jgi:hypothetical protein
MENLLYSPAPIMGLHDRSYRLLFSEPRLVEDLIRGFFQDKWVNRLDFSTLERVNASYVASSLKAREDDMVWKLRFHDGRPVYIYLLLEFQSTPDRFMSVRMMGYEALLLQHLIKEGQLTSDGKLPLVIPIILYNGEELWWPPLDVADLIEEIDPEADQFRPRFRCRLIDEGSYSLEDLAKRQNLVAVLFWLEKTADPADVQRGIARLVDSLPDVRPRRREIPRIHLWTVPAAAVHGRYGAGPSGAAEPGAAAGLADRPWDGASSGAAQPFDPPGPLPRRRHAVAHPSAPRRPPRLPGGRDDGGSRTPGAAGAGAQPMDLGSGDLEPGGRRGGTAAGPRSSGGEGFRYRSLRPGAAGQEPLVGRGGGGARGPVPGER